MNIVTTQLILSLKYVQQGDDRETGEVDSWVYPEEKSPLNSSES